MPTSGCWFSTTSIGADAATPADDSMTTVRPMSDVPELAEQILAGRTRGRVVIDTSA